MVCVTFDKWVSENPNLRFQIILKYHVNFQGSTQTSSYSSDSYHSEPQCIDVTVTREATTSYSPRSHSDLSVTKETTSSTRSPRTSGGDTVTREVRSSRSPARPSSNVILSRETSFSSGHVPVVGHSTSVTRGVTSTRAPLRGGSVTTVTREMTLGGRTSPRSPSHYPTEVLTFMIHPLA